MQNKLLVTWIIAAFLFSALAVASILPTTTEVESRFEELSTSEYVINGNDMSVHENDS